MIKNIIWDFDGTLFDTYPAIAGIFITTLKSFGIVGNRKKVLHMLHKSLSKTYDCLSNEHSIDRETLRSRFMEMEEAMDVSMVVPFNGARQLLTHIIDSGGINLIYTNRGASTFAFLENSGYMKYFLEVITREDGFGRKPSPGCINYFIKKYNLKKSEVLMLGDREIDILAAKNADIKSGYFNSHHIPISIEYDIYIDSLPELLPYLY